MMQRIITPYEIKNPIFEGCINFTEGEGSRLSSEKGWGSKIDDIKSSGPIITIGQPQWWNMIELTKNKYKDSLPKLSLPSNNADFYLLQLACSFHRQEDNHFRWARFSVFLAPEIGNEAPIALDLYPRNIFDKTKTNFKIAITPTLKFENIEGSLGEIAATIEYKKIKPVIIGFGALESKPYWDFEQHNNEPLYGIKFCYLIVKKPRVAEAVRLTLNLHAQVTTRSGWFNAKVTENDSKQLTQIVCGK